MLQTFNFNQFIYTGLFLCSILLEKFYGAPLTWCCSVDQIYSVLLKLLLNHFPQTP